MKALKALMVILPTCCFAMAYALQEDSFKVTQVSEKYAYKGTLECLSQPETASFQECKFAIDKNGKQLNDVNIFVEGSMAMHSHGLPTTPKISWSKEQKAYTINGLKFSMPGQWLLNFTINSSDKAFVDKIAIKVNVK